MTLTIANILAVISFILSISAYYGKKKSDIFTIAAISNIVALVQYLVVNQYSGVLTKVIGILRDISMTKQEKYKILKSKKVLILFILAYIISGIITYKGIFSIFSLLAAAIYTTGCWNADEKKVRKFAIIANFLWIGYNLYTKIYAACVTYVISIITTIIAMCINKENKTIKEND